MNRFQKKGIALGLTLSLLAAVPVVAYADDLDPANMTQEQIIAEFNRLKELEAGDSLDAFVHSLSEEQRRELLSAVITDAVEDGYEETKAKDEGEASIEWKLDEKGALLISGSGDMADFTEPEEAPWYSKRNQISTVTIEPGITRIGSFAFADCPYLTLVKLPAGVKEIGWNAFQNCTSLTKVPVSEGLETIGGNAFEGCTAIQNVKIPDGVIEIGFGAFQKCTGILNVTLPDTLEKVNAAAFADCRELKSVSLPKSLKDLGDGAFLGCESLYSITISEGITEIANNTFKGCTALNFVNMHDDILTIGAGAFEDCVAMHKITFPKNLTVIGDRAFADCVSLTKLVMPDSLTKLGREAFAGCSKLESVELNEGLREIGEDCFQGCSHLAELNLPETETGEETAATEQAEEETVPAETVEEPETIAESAAEETQETTSAEEPAEAASEELDEAAPEPAILVENIMASSGNTVTLALSLQDNPGIVSMSLNVVFDESVLKLVKAEDTGMFSGGEHKQELSSPYRLNWANDTMTTDIADNGCIAVLTFEISEKAQKGTYPIRVEYDLENGDIYNSQLEPISFEVQDGGVTVVNAARGDVNGDGVINGLDRAALNRYLTMGRAGAQDIDLSAADVNGDGKVNNVDRAILSRYLAGWEGYETLDGGEA